jgi:hypothetical protein
MKIQRKKEEKNKLKIKIKLKLIFLNKLQLLKKNH